MPNVAFIKVKVKRILGITRSAEITGKYFSRDEADKCTNPGTVYAAPVAYALLKKING